jgi:hypothetical protein
MLEAMVFGILLPLKSKVTKYTHIYTGLIGEISNHSC